MKKSGRRYKARARRTIFAAFAAFALGTLLFDARAGWAQQNNVGPIPQAVVTPEYTYLPGQPQMIAPAHSYVYLHPQGRYALVSCEEAALPPASLLYKPAPIPAALFLYDAKLRRIRTLWEGHAPHRKYYVSSVHWLPQSNCALAVVDDSPAEDEDKTSNDPSALFSKANVLFFNFDQSLVGRAVATTENFMDFRISVSPTKPQFLVMEDDEKMRMGGATRNGTLGPVISRSTSKFDFIFYDWNADGTAIFGYDPSPYPENFRWFLWDGKTPDIMALRGAPSDTQLARKLPVPPAPVSPLILRTGTAFSILGSLSPQTPATSGANANADVIPDDSFSIAPSIVLHPLYLEAADAATAPTNPNRSTLIAPDADTSYLMPDQSAVLYQTGGATYVVPLTRIKNSAFVQLQKDVTMENASIIRYALFSGAMGNGHGLFPNKAELTEALKKNRLAFGDADRRIRGFVYTPPTMPLREIDAPETVIIGYIVAPKGRAVIYANETVKWVDNP